MNACLRGRFQLTLKEGLTVFRDQEFSGDMGSKDVTRIENVRGLRGRQVRGRAARVCVCVCVCVLCFFVGSNAAVRARLND